MSKADGVQDGKTNPKGPQPEKVIWSKRSLGRRRIKVGCQEMAFCRETILKLMQTHPEKKNAWTNIPIKRRSVLVKTSFEETSASRMDSNGKAGPERFFVPN